MVPDHADHRGRHAQASSQLAARQFAFTDERHLFESQFCCVVPLTLRITTAAALLPVHVLHVGRLCPQKQMIGATTSRGVAPMKNIKSLGDRTIRVQPCQSMSAGYFTLPDKLAVAVLVGRTLEQPTTRRTIHIERQLGGQRPATGPCNAFNCTDFLGFHCKSPSACLPAMGPDILQCYQT